MLLDAGLAAESSLKALQEKEAAYRESQHQISDSSRTEPETIDSQKHLREECFHIPIVIDITELQTQSDPTL